MSRNNAKNSNGKLTLCTCIVFCDKTSGYSQRRLSLTLYSLYLPHELKSTEKRISD